MVYCVVPLNEHLLVIYKQKNLSRINISDTPFYHPQFGRVDTLVT